MIRLTVYQANPEPVGSDIVRGRYEFETPDACAAWLRSEGIDQQPAGNHEFYPWLYFTTYDNGGVLVSAHPDESVTAVDQWRAVWEQLTA